MELFPPPPFGSWLRGVMRNLAVSTVGGGERGGAPFAPFFSSLFSLFFYLFSLYVLFFFLFFYTPFWHLMVVVVSFSFVPAGGGAWSDRYQRAISLSASARFLMSLIWMILCLKERGRGWGGGSYGAYGRMAYWFLGPCCFIGPLPFVCELCYIRCPYPSRFRPYDRLKSDFVWWIFIKVSLG